MPGGGVGNAEAVAIRGRLYDGVADSWPCPLQQTTNQQTEQMTILRRRVFIDVIQGLTCDYADNFEGYPVGKVRLAIF